MENRQILFVDDEPMILEALRRTLRDKRNEWEMNFATSGQEALEALGRGQYDVIVTDIRMPGMDGVQLLTHVREQYPDIIRIVLSGQSEEESFIRLARLAHQYLSKPCDPDTLKRTVDRACTLRSCLTNDRIKRVVSTMDSIPSIPSLYEQIVGVLISPDASMAKIADIVSKDAGMTIKVLQLVNSAYFALPRHVSNILQAVNLLGLDTLKSLVLSLRIFSQFEEKKLLDLKIDKVWRHSLRVGVSAKAIMQCEGLEPAATDDAFMAGMLHDIGKFILATNFEKEYADVKTLAGIENISYSESEMRLLETTHGEIGGYLLALWGLPDPMVEAVAFHHERERCISSGITPTLGVHMADILEHQCRHNQENGNGREWDGSYLERYSKDRILAWKKICECVEAA